jgi:sugar lactone lactonase YvrE
VDGSGNLYIGDTNNSRVRKVSAKDGTITTMAETGVAGSGGDGGLAVNAQLFSPRGVAVDQSGNVYVADANGVRIRRISPNGIINTVAGNGTVGYSGDGGSATAAQISSPSSVTVDSVGNLYIADFGNNRVRKVSLPSGLITTVAGNGSFNYSGDGGPATNAQVGYPVGTAVDGLGSVYFADFKNQRIRKVSSTGTITTIAGTGGTGSSGDGGPATAAQLNLGFYGRLVIDFRGNLYFIDSGNNRVRKISPDGFISTVVGTGTCGYSGDGGPAVVARICGLSDLAIDSKGSLYIGDSGTQTNAGRVRKVTSDGVISTVAGSGPPGDTGDGGLATAAQIVASALAVDATGNIYIAENGYFRIRKVNAATGIITTVVGSGTGGGSEVNSTPATAVSIGNTGGIAVDVPGNLFIQNGNGIDIVTPDGIMNTIAGHFGSGYTGDGGPARQAQLQGAGGISVDFVGNVYFADSGNSAMRVLIPTVPSCSYLVNPTSLQAVGTGGSLTLNIQTNVGCAWTISALPSWISVSGAASGAGPATVTLVAQANTGATRTATISIALTTITVTQPSGVLTITTTSLVPGATGLPYSQTLAVTGGTAPYSWSLTSGTLPGGLTLSTGGTITGTPTSAGTVTISVRVTDASSLTASQTYTLTVISAGTLVHNGSLAHIAVGGWWTTVITLVNTSTSPVAVSVVLHGDDGSILSTLPITTIQQGITRTITGSSINAALNPNTTVLISAGDPTAPTVVGWADVLSSAPVGGFAIFRSIPDTGSPSEGTVPLQTQTPSAIVLPYDNTAGFVMGVALANLSASFATITATMWDDSGTLLGSQGITVAGTGHTSFVLPTQLPLTSGKRGIVRFQSPATGGLAGLGLRFSPFGTFTSVPTM